MCSVVPLGTLGPQSPQLSSSGERVAVGKCHISWWIPEQLIREKPQIGLLATLRSRHTPDSIIVYE